MTSDGEVAAELGKKDPERTQRVVIDEVVGGKFRVLISKSKLHRSNQLTIRLPTEVVKKLGISRHGTGISCPAFSISQAP